MGAKTHQITQELRGHTIGLMPMVVDSNGHVIIDYISLAGTVRNCGGGTTTWNTWITCEETDRFYMHHDGKSQQRHGYCFEVDAFHNGRSLPKPLTAMGRFRHEAATLDRFTGYVYLTEDQPDSCFYRFIPNTPGKLARDGELQVLALKDRTLSDTRKDFLSYLYQPLEVEWISLTNNSINVDPDDDTLRWMAHSLGAAMFARGEGMSWDKRGTIYWSCTTGGDLGKGQIFSYDDRSGTMMLQLEVINDDNLDMPDSMAINRFDGSMYLLEDGLDDDQYICGATPRPHIVDVGVAENDPASDSFIFKFVRNNIGQSEITGGQFSADATRFFFNIWEPGITFMLYRTDGLPITPKSLTSTTTPSTFTSTLTASTFTSSSTRTFTSTSSSTVTTLPTPPPTPEPTSTSTRMQLPAPILLATPFPTPVSSPEPTAEPTTTSETLVSTATLTSTVTNTSTTFVRLELLVYALTTSDLSTSTDAPTSTEATMITKIPTQGPPDADFALRAFDPISFRSLLFLLSIVIHA